MNDQGPDHIAALDRLGAAQARMAGVLGEYFDALLEHDFNRDEALAIVRDWQEAWLDYSLARPSDDEQA